MAMKSGVLTTLGVVDFYATNDWVEEYDFGPSMTRQEFAEECDINVLMARYERTGALPVNGREPYYVDFTEMPQDLMGYMEFMKEAGTAFMTLPAAVRKDLDNDPIKFVEFASDPGNLDTMREWGLAPPAKASPVEPSSEPAAAPAPPAPSAPVKGA